MNTNERECNFKKKINWSLPERSEIFHKHKKDFYRKAGKFGKRDQVKHDALSQCHPSRICGWIDYG